MPPKFADPPQLSSSSNGDSSNIQSQINEITAEIEQLKLDILDISPKPLFPVWAEEQGDLGTGLSKWAFGNGNDTPTNMGFVLPFACRLVAMSLSLEGAVSCAVRINKNNSDTTFIVATDNSRQGHVIYDEPLEFESGDYFAFKTVIGHASSNADIVCAWFERDV